MDENFNTNQPVDPAPQSKNMTVCKSCGNRIAKNAKVCPSCGAKNRKPIFKRVWFWILIVFIIVIIGAVSGGSGDSSNGTNNADSTSSSENAAVKTEKTNSNSIGQYSLEIQSARLTQTYDGKPAVVVTYKYTNNSNDTPTAFYVAFDDEVYQNGVGLNESYFLRDGDPYSADNKSKEIKKGSSITVESAFELNDSSTPIDVEVKELFSFNDETISKTFNLK